MRARGCRTSLAARTAYGGDARCAVRCGAEVRQTPRFRRSHSASLASQRAGDATDCKAIQELRGATECILGPRYRDHSMKCHVPRTVSCTYHITHVVTCYMSREEVHHSSPIFYNLLV
eukprot:scaffold33547_cov129-Isochrysis_galbana.AAC.4